MKKKCFLIRGNKKTAVFWLLLLLLLFCSYRLYLYHGESTQTMTGQNQTPQSWLGTLAQWTGE